MLKNDIELFVEKFSENLPRSLERIYGLLDRIDNPQNSIKNVIHIAGTNGKGSVLSYIKSCLLMDKQKVNAFTSPHLIKITERILIDNKFVDDEVFVRTFDSLLAKLNQEEIVFFEFMTACAFFLFNRNKADWNLFEVGMGGKYDATNTLPMKDLAVITPISYDHENYLGDDIFQITKEKLGITSNKIPTVIGKQSDRVKEFILKNFLSNQDNRFVFDMDWTMTKKKEFYYYEDNEESIRINNQFMYGEHQKINAATSIASLRFLNKLNKINLSKDIIEKGISNTHWRGRLEKIDCENNLVELWVDSCHNPSGSNAVATEISKMNFKEKRKTKLIFSLKKGKKINDFIAPFVDVCSEISYVEGNKANYSYNEITEKISNMNIKIRNIKNLDKSLIYKEDSPSRILICGSMQLVGKAISIF